MLPRIIGLIGYIRAGKTTAANYLAERYGYQLASNSDLLRDIAMKLEMLPTRENLGKVGDAIFSSLGNEAIANYRIKESANYPIVVDGIRYLEEVAIYKVEPTFRLIGVVASEDVRYFRMQALAHDLKDMGINREKFDELSFARSELTVPTLLARADGIVENNSDVSGFEKKFDEVMDLWMR